MTTWDGVVVGGGVFGATAALTLAQRGHSVALIDPGPLPHPLAASTDISKVVRMDYGADAFYMALMEQALRGWRQWNQDWPQPLFHEIGFSLLKKSEMVADSYEGESFRLLRQRGHPVERLDAQMVADRFPVWDSAGVVDGYFNPQGGWAEAAKVVAQLLDLAEAAGVALRPGEKVIELSMDGEQVNGVSTDSERYRSGWTVIAAGSWTSRLLPELKPMMWPVAQPVIHYRAPQANVMQPPAFVTWALDIAETGWYGFPALDDGTLKLANHGQGARLNPDRDHRVSAAADQRYRRFLRLNWPALGEAERIWDRLCYYADSWDGDFYLDAVPGKLGLFVASGGSGHAFKFAPVLGDLIADVVEGSGNPDLDRFRWRQPGDRRTEAARHIDIESG